jgi:alpha-1,6-mannosyltransferase
VGDVPVLFDAGCPNPAAPYPLAVRAADLLVLSGTVGSVLVTVGGFGVGAVPASLADQWLHDSSTGRAVSTGLCAAGVLVLLASWWRLRGASPRRVLLAAAAWSAPLLVAPSLFSRDVYAYAAQAHLVAVGLDPYSHGPADAPGALAAEVDDVWAHARSPYGPVFLRLASWLVPGQHVVGALLVLRVLAAVGLALLAWGLGRLAADPGRSLWLGVANPLVLLHGVGGAHNDLLMAGLLCAGLAIALLPGRGEPRLAAATAVIVVAALVKAPAAAGLAFLPFLVPMPRLRAAVVVAASAVASAVVVTTAAGLGWGWVHTLGAGNARRSLLSLSTGAGVLAGNLAGNLAGDGAGDGAVRVAHAAGLLVAAALGLWLLLRAPRIGGLPALGWTLLAVAALGPVVQPWYLIWALAALAAVAGPRLAAGLAAASAVLCLLVLPGGRHLIRPPLYGVPAVLVAAAGCAAARAAIRTNPAGDGLLAAKET